ncbi:hypothetical protein [Magnetospirillum sulfuroxidans]|uniref:C2H2-type domain-containing protein n=1 Tax=Magnetospirillum sulfuroxidans TaxID=611300 RepID=A0ABS5ICA4_9PROT|nr:hypothetical protein [Magnetospirillum sulfuroxidans]MBR9972054.1 hypothetical protein [Magnetospirillum sulfuroxidans]
MSPAANASSSTPVLPPPSLMPHDARPDGDPASDKDDGKVECLICHQRYRSLAAHLHSHGVAAEEYRSRFPDALIHGPGARGGRPRKMAAGAVQASPKRDVLVTVAPSECSPSNQSDEGRVAESADGVALEQESTQGLGAETAGMAGQPLTNPGDEGPVSRPSATGLDVFEDPPRIRLSGIKELESDAIFQWTSDLVAGWKNRHDVSRERHAVLYRFVWHALYGDPDGFRLICKARVKAPKHPYQLPVRHFFSMLAKTVKAEIEGEMAKAGCDADTARKLAAEAMVKEVNVKSLTDYSVRIIRWAGEHRGEHADEWGVCPDAFGTWFDSQGGATAIRAAHDEKYASRRNGPTEADEEALAKAKGASSGEVTDSTESGEDAGCEPVVRRHGEQVYLVLPRLLLVRLRRALEGALDNEGAKLRNMISQALDGDSCDV